MYNFLLDSDEDFPVKARLYRHQTEATLFTLRLFDALPGQQPTPGGHGAALLMEMGTGKTLCGITVMGVLSLTRRIHRVSQTENCHYIYLCCRDTVDYNP